MRLRPGWTFHKQQGVYMSPTGTYAIQRENTVRWSMWHGKKGDRLVHFKLVGEYFRRLEQAQEDAESREKVDGR